MIDVEIKVHVERDKQIVDIMLIYLHFDESEIVSLAIQEISRSIFLIIKAVFDSGSFSKGVQVGG